MPHRPQGQGSSNSETTSLYTPPRVPGAAAASIMRQSSTLSSSNVSGLDAAVTMAHNNSSSNNNNSHPSTGSSTTASANAAAMYHTADRYAAGIVTPLAGNNNNKAWLSPGTTTIGRNHHPGALLPSLNKSTDSADTRSVENASHTDAASVATLATENYDDDREATASALLMVAKAAEREHINNMIHAANLMASSSSSSLTLTVMPLKKRKQLQQDYLRYHHSENCPENENEDEGDDDDDDGQDSITEATNGKEVNTSTTAVSAAGGGDELDPCHVSPVSHSSAEHGLRTESTDESSTPPTRRLLPPNRTNRITSFGDSKELYFASSSYRSMERKDVPTSTTTTTTTTGGGTSIVTQELLDSAKVYHAAQIGAPKHHHQQHSLYQNSSQVLIPHFPTVLHQALSDKDCQSAIQWLPDGEAWKVCRWDGLRRQVLPRYFSDLRDEMGSSCGTIDAFLFHLSAWGFEEIKNGSDAGSYRHDLFIRGAQKLCVKMRFTGGDDATTTHDHRGSSIPASPYQVRSAEAERSMLLQVPTLTTIETGEVNNLSNPHNKRPRYNDGSSPSHGPMHWPYGGGGGSSSESQAISWSGGPFLSDAPPLMYNNMRGGPSMGGGTYPPPLFGADRRVSVHGSNTPESVPPPSTSTSAAAHHHPHHQYTPPQVRSGRGAMRISGRAATNSPSTTPLVRQGISVSNRGKGPRKPAACRSPLTTTTTTKHTSSPATVVVPPNREDVAPSPIQDKKEEMRFASAAAAAQNEAERVGHSVQGVAIAISRKLKRKLPLLSSLKKHEDGSIDSVAAAAAADPTTTTSLSDDDEECNSSFKERPRHCVV
ncbi:HSF-type DNA-binding protein [Nitzschia inconspicua]|uniref:HSF-type DNA-binding protein n=1 Tax=Nitzschia inconspicua TaxID=303405 RepID=A0A9K3KW31_9STRA|nr:HSF-type DNA-binding protein [Nitzschia inconspicua]